VGNSSIQLEGMYILLLFCCCNGKLFVAEFHWGVRVGVGNGLSYLLPSRVFSIVCGFRLQRAAEEGGSDDGGNTFVLCHCRP